MEDRNRVDFSERPVLKVLGVGGGGNNSINRMIEQEVHGVIYCAINTDSQALRGNHAEERIRIGKNLTRGLGAGAHPEIGRQAAEEDIDEIRKAVEGVDLAFITCGMGGGTGTGAAPIVAQCAKEAGALVVGIVTKPFKFEGKRRMEEALVGINNIRPYCDTLIIIPNEKLLDSIGANTTTIEAFNEVDNVVFRAIQGIAGIIDETGVINVDFSDLKTVLEDKGTALIGIGVQTGPNRAIEAVRQAIESPLLEIDINGATDAIVQIIAPNDFNALELKDVNEEVSRASTPDINIIFGLSYDPEATDEVRVIIVASGFNQENSGKIISSETQGESANNVTNNNNQSKENSSVERKPSKVPSWLQNDNRH